MPGAAWECPRRRGEGAAAPPDPTGIIRTRLIPGRSTIGVAVYPRLGRLLSERKLTVADLERRIEAVYGRSVDSRTLQRLTLDAPIQRADLEIVALAAAVLGVGLDELFAIETSPVVGILPPEEDAVLEPGAAARLADLLERQSNAELTPAEVDELGALLAEYGRRRHERAVTELALRRNTTVQEASRRTAEELATAVEWWSAFSSDPRRQEPCRQNCRNGNPPSREPSGRRGPSPRPAGGSPTTECARSARSPCGSTACSGCPRVLLGPHAGTLSDRSRDPTPALGRLRGRPIAQPAARSLPARP